MQQNRAFQDCYPDELSHCYGCGRLNEHGLQIKSYWDGDEAVARYTPQAYHMAMPGFVYGGLIASLIDCHSTGTAAAALCREQAIDLDCQTAPRFVTASLKVDYLKPTPLGCELTLRSKITEIKGRKVVIESDVWVEGVVTARGEVVAVQMPDSFGR